MSKKLAVQTLIKMKYDFPVTFIFLYLGRRTCEKSLNILYIYIIDNYPGFS